MKSKKPDTKSKKPMLWEDLLDRAKKRLTVGQPTKYDPKEHIPLLVDVFGRGEGVASFCAQAIICQKTFFKWLDAHEPFDNAYRITLSIGQRYWESPGVINNINPKAWHTIMRNRFHYDKVRVKDLNVDGAAIDHMKVILKGIKNGDLDINDANKLAQLAITQVQIEDRAPIAESTILPRNELLRQIETIKAVMDAQKEQGK